MLNFLKYHQVRCIFILLFLNIFLFITGNVFAETAFKVFQTQQPAQNLISSIVPLYGQSEKFTAKNNQLIVKVPEHVLLEIEQLLRGIDQPLQNLLIEISSSLNNDGNFQADNIGYNTDNTDNSNITTMHTRRRSSDDAPSLFSIRAVAGWWPSIQTGQRVPYYNQQWGEYGAWQNATQLVNVTSGFDVFPIINGDRVTLKIRPYNSEMNKTYSRRINSHSLDTSITGTLGQRIFLGSAVNEINSQNVSNNLGYNSGYKNKNLSVNRYTTRRTLI